MIGLDTNVLVRFLVQDDEPQFDRALQLIKSEVNSGQPVLIALLVVLETEWILRSRYLRSKAEILEIFSDLLDSLDVRVESPGTLDRALSLWKDSAADFAECLIGAWHQALGCRATASFDAKAAKLPHFISP